MLSVFTLQLSKLLVTPHYDKVSSNSWQTPGRYLPGFCFPSKCEAMLAQCCPYSLPFFNIATSSVLPNFWLIVSGDYLFHLLPGAGASTHTHRWTKCGDVQSRRVKYTLAWGSGIPFRKYSSTCNQDISWSLINPHFYSIHIPSLFVQNGRGVNVFVFPLIHRPYERIRWTLKPTVF